MAQNGGTDQAPWGRGGGPPHPPRPRTRVQEQLDDLEVGVGHAVVQGRVAVAVRHVDDVAQDLGGHGREGRQVVPHHGRDRRLLAGHAEPLVLQGVQAEPLPK